LSAEDVAGLAQPLEVGLAAHIGALDDHPGAQHELERPKTLLNDHSRTGWRDDVALCVKMKAKLSAGKLLATSK
jgi:hypothetical protein